MNILFEDKYLLICEKPVGVSSEPDGTGTDVITFAVVHTGGECFPVHRLDRVTGGAIVVAKTPAAAAKLSAMAQSSSISKEYLAVIEGVPPEERGVMEDLLFWDRQKLKSFVVDRKRAGVKEALLEYKLLDTNGGVSLVLIKLHTGRTHQIRVQFASRKMPILGDGKYGSRTNKCSAALRSFRISFTHPFTGEKITVVSPPEGLYPWIEFNICEKLFGGESFAD